MWTISEVECLGACVNAPMIQINDDYYVSKNNVIVSNFSIYFNLLHSTGATTTTFAICTTNPVALLWRLAFFLSQSQTSNLLISICSLSQYLTRKGFWKF